MTLARSLTVRGRASFTGSRPRLIEVEDVFESSVTDGFSPRRILIFALLSFGGEGESVMGLRFCCQNLCCGM